MICKNCSAEFDEICEVCPECGEKVEEKVILLISDDEEESVADFETEFEEICADESDEIPIIIEKAAEVEAEAYGETEDEENQQLAVEENIVAKAETEEAADEAEYSDEADAEKTEAETATYEPEDYEQADDTASQQKNTESEQQFIKEDVDDFAQKKSAGQKRRTAKRKNFPDKVETSVMKRAAAGIVAVMVLVAAISIGVSVIRLKTDVLDEPDPVDKTVVNMSFTVENEKELESLIAKSFSAAKKAYNYAQTDAETFLERINPADKGNFYSRINGVVEPLMTEADPAERFADENGEYAYYKLEEAKVDKVLDLFSVESYRGESTKDYYYCEGYYYFAHKAVKETPEVAAKIVQSKRVLDGSYYVEAYFYLESAPETAKTSSCYFIVEMNKDSETGDADFVIKKMSAEPLYGADGTLLETARGGERKTEVIEGITSDGKLVCKYTVNYPVIEGSDAGSVNVREFFKNAISVYQLKADASDERYKAFHKKGGDDSLLPLVENVVAEVVFEDENNISFIGKISHLDPVATKIEQPEGEEGEVQAYAVRFYERSVEAYTIDKATGNFVSKDSILGKDYMLISEILYRIYSGYEYSDLIASENAEVEVYVDAPADTEELGAKIYECPWSLTQEGVTFYFVTQEGFIKEIVIPYDTVKALKG